MTDTLQLPNCMTCPNCPYLKDPLKHPAHIALDHLHNLLFELVVVTLLNPLVSLCGLSVLSVVHGLLVWLYPKYMQREIWYQPSK